MGGFIKRNVDRVETTALNQKISGSTLAFDRNLTTEYNASFDSVKCFAELLYY